LTSHRTDTNERRFWSRHADSRHHYRGRNYPVIRVPRLIAERSWKLTGLSGVQGTMSFWRISEDILLTARLKMKYSVNLLLLLIVICFCVEDAFAKHASDRLFQITGDRTERKAHGKILRAYEHAEGQIIGQDAKIEADTIAFDEKTRIVEASGHVRIIRNSKVTTGAQFKFKVDSNEYLVTQPGIHVTGSKLICRN